MATAVETLNGWRTATLENEELRVVLLPDKGGDVWELRHVPSDTQVIWQAPWGLKPGPRVPAGAAFDDWYAGGWQDLLPNGNEACALDGAVHGFHGESWARAWDFDGEELAVELETVPLRVRKTLRLEGSTLVIDERVENAGPAPVRFMWGHHPALGGDLLAAGCEIDLAGGLVEGYHERLGATSRLAPRAPSAWPHAVGTDGRAVDLRTVPGPEARTHDVTLLTGLAAGWYAVRNPKRGVGFALRFPREIFRWLWIWQAYGGAGGPPCYTLALEPFTSPPCLARAAARGEEARLEPGESLEARIEATIFAGAEPVRSVEAGGRVVH